MSDALSPLDTSGVKLSTSLKDLREKLAEHVHAIWTQGRVNDGWIKGPERNDVLKTHPCLIPYPELPESEKEYDRRTAEETIKAILALGYTINEP